MERFTRTDLQDLLAERPGPCVSIYMPTGHGGSEQDPVRFGNLLDEAEDRLTAGGMRAPEAREMLASARKLLPDSEYWRHAGEGLACFVAEGLTRTYRLPMRFDERLTVARHFDVRPILPWLDGDGRFYVLALSQNGVRLLEGSAHGVRRIEPRHLPANMAEALRAHDTDEVLTFHARPTSGGGWGAIFEGHGVGIDDHKDDLLSYFQKIDRALRPILADEKAPLLLATVEYLMPIYRKANSYPHLMDKGLPGNPDRMSEKELHDRAWPLVAPHFRERQERALAMYRQFDGTGRTAHDPAAVVGAAIRGELETLFLVKGREVWGRFDPTDGWVEAHDKAKAGDEDLANIAAVYALRHGRTVYTAEPAEALDGSPLAGTFFVPLAKHGK